MFDYISRSNPYNQAPVTSSPSLVSGKNLGGGFANTSPNTHVEETVGENGITYQSRTPLLPTAVASDVSQDRRASYLNPNNFAGWSATGRDVAPAPQPRQSLASMYEELTRNALTPTSPDDPYMMALQKRSGLQAQRDAKLRGIEGPMAIGMSDEARYGAGLQYMTQENQRKQGLARQLINDMNNVAAEREKMDIERMRIVAAGDKDALDRWDAWAAAVYKDQNDRVRSAYQIPGTILEKATGIPGIGAATVNAGTSLTTKPLVNPYDRPGAR